MQYIDKLGAYGEWYTVMNEEDENIFNIHVGKDAITFEDGGENHSLVITKSEARHLVHELTVLLEHGYDDD